MSAGTKHEGHRKRLRERFLSGDPTSRSDAALLELFLTYAIPQRDVQPLAKSLIARFGGLEGVLGASSDELCKIEGLKQNSVVLLKVAEELLRRKLTSKYPAKPVVSNSKAREGEPTIKQGEMPEIVKVAQQTPTTPAKPAFRRPVARYGSELFGKAVLRESIEMLPKLPDSENLDEIREFLRQNLHFSAEGTRSRYANYIIRRMFPDGIADAALRNFARAFTDSTELRDVCFYRFCKAEPLMLKITRDVLIPSLGLGRVSRQKLKDYLTHRFPQSGSIKDCINASVEALDAAEVAQSTRSELQFRVRPIQPASFAFILHSEFPEPDIYDIEKAESNPYLSCQLWDPGQITNALYECRNRGWINKVSQIDNVRQFTLRHRLQAVVQIITKEVQQR